MTYHLHSKRCSQRISKVSTLSVNSGLIKFFKKTIERNNELFFCITYSLLAHISRRIGDDKMFLFTGKTVGLLGIWDDDTKNDFTLPNGEQIDINSKSSTIHWNFGQKCKLERGGRPDELL